jgi:tetratricopeptide (TPR) repeat protein
LRAYATAKLYAEGRLDILESRIDQYYVHSTRNAYLTAGVPARDDLGACPPGILAEDFSDFAAACEWYLRERSVLDVVTRSLSSRDDKRNAVRLAIDRRLLSFEVDSYEQFVDILEYALECAEVLGDDVTVAEIRRQLGRGLGLLGKHEEAKLQLELATEVFRTVGDELGQIMCQHTRASIAMDSGDLEQAQADYIEVSQRARAHEMDWLASRSSLQAACTFQLQSNYLSALEWCYLARELNTAEEHDLHIRHELVCCYTELRRYGEAIEVAEQHPPLFADRFLSDNDITSLPFLAYSYYSIGNIPKALAACARFLPRITDIQSRLVAAYKRPTDLQRVQEILLATGNEHWAAGLAEESV